MEIILVESKYGITLVFKIDLIVWKLSIVGNKYWEENGLK